MRNTIGPSIECFIAQHLIFENEGGFVAPAINTCFNLINNSYPRVGLQFLQHLHHAIDISDEPRFVANFPNRRQHRCPAPEFTARAMSYYLT